MRVEVAVSGRFLMQSGSNVCAESAPTRAARRIRDRDAITVTTCSAARISCATLDALVATAASSDFVI